MASICRVNVGPQSTSSKCESSFVPPSPHPDWVVTSTELRRLPPPSSPAGSKGRFLSWFRPNSATPSQGADLMPGNPLHRPAKSV